MLSEELKDLVLKILDKKCEMQNIELKSAEKGTPTRLYDTLSSFSNQTGGGIIIFGINEKNDYEITGVFDPQKLQTDVTNQSLQMEPVVRPVFTLADLDGKTVVSAEISECDIFEKPCFYKGAGRIRGSYIRVGEADMPMTEYEIYSYEVFKRKIQDKLRIVERADKSCLNQDALDEYLFHLKKAKPKLIHQPLEKILQLQGFMDKDRPTLAGIMMFGEYPQAYFPQLCVTAMVIDGTEFALPGENGERFIDNQRIEGTIPQMIEDTISFIRRNMKNSTVINTDGKRDDRTEYPVSAIREIVLNALIHRDYSIHTENSPVRVLMYKNRIEIENPGGLYGRITVNELGKIAADTRNPFIAGGLEVLQITENRFSGIPIIVNEMKKSGLEPAVFENKRGFFKVTLYNDTKQDRHKKIVLPDDMQKVVEFCNVPRSRKEIAEHMGISTSYYAMTKYIRPLLDMEILKMTMPDVPKSKKQKFVSAQIL